MSPQRAVGFSAVARLAGVSTATVSNTLNRPQIVSPETRARVAAAMRELDFVPNRAAATLRQGWNRLIGLVIPDITNPFYAAIVDAVVEAADQEHFAVALCVSHDDPERELRHFDLLAEQRAAGAIVVPVGADESRLSQLRIVGSHVIFVDRIADVSQTCSVSVDDVKGGQIATRHLLSGPGTGLTLVNGSPGISQCAARRDGVLLELNGVPLTEIEVAEMTIENGLHAARRILSEGLSRRIFCTNDQLAIGVLRGLAEAGVEVPSEAAVVGYGDLAVPAKEEQILSTVSQPKQLMGQAAVTALLAELREGAAHQHSSVVFEPRLVSRTSTP